MNVLIAHGGAGSRRRLAAALEPLEPRVVEAVDGAEALDALLGRRAPRVALVDWDLPSIEGPEVCRQLRDVHLERPPYVILLAGDAHRARLHLGLRAGANDCLPLAVSPGELRGRVRMGARVSALPWGRTPQGAWARRPGI